MSCLAQQGSPFYKAHMVTFEKNLSPFPLPLERHFHVTRQQLLIWKWGFSIALWKDSFIISIMSVFLLLDIGGKLYLSCSWSNLLLFTFCPLGLPHSWTCSVVTFFPSLCWPIQFKGFAHLLSRSTQSLRWDCDEVVWKKKQEIFFLTA